MVVQCRKWNDQTSIASVTYALALSSPQALSSSLRSEAVCSVNCFNAEWGIRCLVVSTESRSPRRRPRRRDDSLGVFGVSDNNPCQTDPPPDSARKAAVCSPRFVARLESLAPRMNLGAPGEAAISDKQFA